MKNLIYQYWYGNTMETISQHGKIEMEKYAERIGVEYRFDMNPQFIAKNTNHATHMSALRPVFDKAFHEYDKVMYVDCDIFPKEGCEENIFEEEIKDIGICEEVHMPKLRVNNPKCQDEQWNKYVKELYGKSLPRNEDGLIRVFNTGLVMYTQEGMKRAFDSFVPMNPFMKKFQRKFQRPLYYRDQSYIPVMLEVSDVEYTVMNTKWNSQVHWKPNTKGPKRPVIDMRKDGYQFVHIQLTGSGNWGMDKIFQVVNLPNDQWEI